MTARHGLTKKNAANIAAFSFPALGPEKSGELTYFDTDFLNMRSIFSLIASMAVEFD